MTLELNVKTFAEPLNLFSIIPPLFFQLLLFMRGFRWAFSNVSHSPRGNFRTAVRFKRKS